MARVVLIIESRIIGRRFAGGPCFFPGFGRSVSIPDWIYAGYLPVLAMVFSSVAIPLCISGGPHFTYSAFSPSSPTLFFAHMCIGDEKLLRLKQLPSVGTGLITELLIQLVTMSRGSVVKLTVIGSICALRGKCPPPVTLIIWPKIPLV